MWVLQSKKVEKESKFIPVMDVRTVSISNEFYWEKVKNIWLFVEKSSNSHVVITNMFEGDKVWVFVRTCKG